jgi:hypothetical protein
MMRRHRQTRWSFAVASLVVMAFGAVASAQDIYRWTDEKGVVHFGNAPAGVKQNMGSVGPKLTEDDRFCRQQALKKCNEGDIFGPEADQDIRVWNDFATQSWKECRDETVRTCLLWRRQEKERQRKLQMQGQAQ